MNLGNTCFFNSVMQVFMYVYIIFVSIYIIVQCEVIHVYNISYTM